MSAKIINFVEMLDLPEEHEYQALKNSVTASAKVSVSAEEATNSDNKQSAQVNAGSLTSFTDKLKGQQKADVQNSTLLAQLAANKKYDRFHEPMDWYKFYLDVLGNVGWNQPAFAFDHYESGGTTVNLDQATLGILSAIASANEIALVKATMDALKNLSNDSKQLNIWNANASDGNNGTFQIMPVDISPNSNDVVMTMTGMQFTAHETHGGFLWWSWDSTSIEIQRAADKFVLNESVYSQIRSSIVSKLGDKAKSFVADLDI